MEWAVLLVASLLVLAASYRGWWTIGVAEAWGFATGGVCVWLVVREHLWNWPIGLANNVFFLVLFFRSRLYADMGLQVVYFGLGVYGWLNWLFGGENRTVLRVSRTTRIEWLALAVAIPVCAWGLREILLAANGAAPFWDALTTVLSLAAQYLLCRKRFENWWFWIAWRPWKGSRQLRCGSSPCCSGSRPAWAAAVLPSAARRTARRRARRTSSSARGRTRCPRLF